MYGRAASSAMSIATSSGTRSRRSRNLPREMRSMSKRSSIRRESCSIWRSITPWLHATSGSCDPLRPRIATAFLIGASGPRSSCASVARNSSFRRSASFAAWMSMPVATQPSTRPAASCVGV